MEICERGAGVNKGTESGGLEEQEGRVTKKGSRDRAATKAEG